MNGDLVALGIALLLGAAVVILGLRRELSETTRDGIPRFHEDPQESTMALGLYEGEERPRRPLTPVQRRWLALFWLLLALNQAASAVLTSDDRLIHAALGAGFLFTAGMVLLRKQSS